VKTWMSGGVEPLEESTNQPPRGFRDQRPRVLPRLGYALALVWVTVGLMLFLIEVVGLAAGRG
jgi:hypothetical protein